MIDRPALPPGAETVPGAADAAAWLADDISPA
jgi:hypothetical protein